MNALQIHAGPRALQHLRDFGLRAADVRVIPAAAGGPKGLVLNPLDRFLFGHWLTGAGPAVHLLGASIGAWRMAVACMDDAEAAFTALADGYVAQDYTREPGRWPSAAEVSAAFSATLAQQLQGRHAQVLNHPRFRLHVFTSRGRHVLRREGRWRTPLGYAGAFVSNAIHRQALSLWLERVIFSDPRQALPLALHDYRTHQVQLDGGNLHDAILASCSIPFALKSVSAISGAPQGAYWDGGITDYHLHLNYASMAEGLVLYPHFQATVVPGWLDKAFKHRHRASAKLDNLVLLSPSPQWIASLPNGKLPDRSDFKVYAGDAPGRMKAWRAAVNASQQLADEFAQTVTHGRPVHALPLR